jgi:hypothetical protein
LEQLKLIQLVVDKIEKLAIPYFITGSIASSYYGIPRYTHDIDVVVTISEKDSGEIIRVFSDEGYISQEGIRDALSGTGMFNFIHSDTGLKVDFWIDRGEPFTKSCFARARHVELSEGFWVMMASPEDVLLHKVYWDHLMASERQLRDAQGILSVLGQELDMAYMEKWAKELGIEDSVQRLLTQNKLPNLET